MLSFISNQKLLYDKLATVIIANTSAAAVLVALGKAHNERSERIANELQETVRELGNLLRHMHRRGTEHAA